MAAILVVTSCGGASAQPRVLLDTSGSGNASLTVESTQAGGFDMQWSYDCANAGGRGVFVADVYSPDGAPDFKSPGVSEEGDVDSGDYHVPGAGRFEVKITSTCAWKLKVVVA